MMATEQAILKARGRFDEIVDLVRRDAEPGERIDVVERDLMRHLPAPGHSLLTVYMAQRGDGDSGPEITTTVRGTACRLPEPHGRRHLSIFRE